MWEVPGSLAPAPAPLTFLAVVFVVVQDEAAAALALVAAEGVDAVLLTAAVVLGALVLVCRGANKGRPRVCAGRRSGRSPQGKWEAWLGFLPPGAGWAGVRVQGDDRVRLWGEKGEVGWREGWVWS